MKILKEILCKKESEEIKKLKQENDELKAKLVEKQEHINKTNSYYKKKIYAMKNPK